MGRRSSLSSSGRYLVRIAVLPAEAGNGFQLPKGLVSSKVVECVLLSLSGAVQPYVHDEQVVVVVSHRYAILWFKVAMRSFVRLP